jgi:hypothetical protein
MNDVLRKALLEDAEPKSGGSECPKAEELWKSAGGELTKKENEEIVLHIGECGYCATAWRLAREMAEEKVPVGDSHPARAPTVRGWAPWLAAAAVLVVAVALGLQLTGPLLERQPVYRTQEGALLAPITPDGGSLPRDGFVLRWTAGPQGTSYDVRLTTEDLDLLAQGRMLEANEFRVPEETLAELPTGARLFWQVTAHVPDGRRIDSDSFLVIVE